MMDRFGERVLSTVIINNYGWTPLHAACYHGKLDIVRFLIEKCYADPNLKNINGWNSLIFAVMGYTQNQRMVDDEGTDSVDVIEYLLNNTDADPLLSDNSGNRALFYANSVDP
jgi:Ankyrin repeats (many copies)